MWHAGCILDCLHEDELYSYQTRLHYMDVFSPKSCEMYILSISDRKILYQKRIRLILFRDITYKFCFEKCFVNGLNIYPFQIFIVHCN